MKVVSFTIETNNEKIAQSANREINGSGNIVAPSSDGYFHFSERTVVRALKRHIGDLRYWCRQFPEAYVKLSYSCDGQEGVYTNNAGKFQEIEPDSGDKPYLCFEDFDAGDGMTDRQMEKYRDYYECQNIEMECRARKDKDFKAAMQLADERFFSGDLGENGMLGKAIKDTEPEEWEDIVGIYPYKDIGYFQCEFFDDGICMWFESNENDDYDYTDEDDYDDEDNDDYGD